jgi:hypothetical protein
MRELASVTCRIFTKKAGALSAMGHDLEIAVERASVRVADDRTRVEASFDATSLVVLGPSELSERDKRKIEQTIRDDVLAAARFPMIRFTSTRVTGLHVDGTLELHGVSRAIACDVSENDGVWRADVRLHQPDFRIVPYTAMLGALKVQPEVRVVVAAKI